MRLVGSADAGPPPAPDSDTRRWRSRAHFLCAAAKAMRNVLVDHARRGRSMKRSTPGQRLVLDDAIATYEERALDVLALDEALERLAQEDAELARVVELRFFGGLTAAPAAASASARTTPRRRCT